MRLPKLTIRTKISLALLCSMLPLVGVGLYSIRLTANALEKNALDAAAEEVFLKAKRIERFLKNSQNDFLFLVRTPALRALVDAADTQRPAGESERDVAFWREKVEQEFLAFSLNRRIYQQILYADEHVREIVRIDRPQGERAADAERSDGSLRIRLGELAHHNLVVLRGVSG